jgi:hypothetical protein
MPFLPSEVAALVSIAEFVRLCGIVDHKCGKEWTKFNVIRLGRDKGGIAIQVDTEKCGRFWVAMNGTNSYVQVNRPVSDDWGEVA